MTAVVNSYHMILAWESFLTNFCTLLLHFRASKIGLVMDIEKAFHHVQLNEVSWKFMQEEDNEDA